jgi:hypothetical protein
LHNIKLIITFAKNMEQEIYYFEDWVSYMLNHTDYSLIELEDFYEYYQNLLTFEENLDEFEKRLSF